MIQSEFEQVIYLVITTEKNKKTACELANLLLDERLTPCVNFKNIESYFWWEGEISQSKEVQLMIKCQEEKLDDICNKINNSHSYEVPEIIYFPVSATKNYYIWVNSI
tara:strand:+ start:814 stop:1137 length:324 start_codon:yes stop_codon:yes gene_type:complete